MMPNQQLAGLFSGIRQMSPNANLNIVGNNLEIVIPFDDIVDTLKKSIPDNIRPAVRVEVVESGIKIVARLF